MTLKELLDRCEFQDIAPYILKIFPEHKYQLIYYKMAFDILRNMKLELNPDSNVKQIEIFYFEEYDVSVYSCEGDYWESSLAKEIVLLDGLTLANEEIAARCLWSITFYGFSPSERDETFDSFGNFEKRFPSQATIIKNTIRTLTFDTSSFKSEELQYLFDTEPFIREYRSYSYQADQRIGYLIDLIANYERIDFLEYTDFILMFRTSPEYPLTRSETDTLQNFFRNIFLQVQIFASGMEKIKNWMRKSVYCWWETVKRGKTMRKNNHEKSFLFATHIGNNLYFCR